MKQKDLALIGVMVIVSAFLSLLLSRFFFSSSSNRSQNAEIVDAITSDFPQPPDKYFNLNSINPTQQIQIGENQNPNPFNSKPQ
jgi:hypothetical protein